MLFKSITSTSLQDYRDLIKLAEETGVYKACGNSENMWVMLKFEDEAHFDQWLRANI